jgi:hypothetical protein
VIQRLSCDFRSHPTELSNFADDLTSAMRVQSDMGILSMCRTTPH